MNPGKVKNHCSYTPKPWFTGAQTQGHREKAHRPPPPSPQGEREPKANPNTPPLELPKPFVTPEARLQAQ